MPDIVDVSPMKSNTPSLSTDQSATGRMLSIASSPDGKLVLAGSYSNVWAWNNNVGDLNHPKWEQITTLQPDPAKFEVKEMVGGWAVIDIAIAAGFDNTKHLVVPADVTGDARADVVGFRDGGVWTAINNGDGTFQPAKFALDNFGYNQGWRLDKHPRFLAKLTDNPRADIVGFGDAGVWTALSNGDGTFQQAKFVIADFGYDHGWRVDRHPRFLADLTGDGRADIVGFGNDGVWIALGNGDGTFQAPAFVVGDLGYNQGWRVDKHPRFVADLTGDGRADLLGFGQAGVWTALGNGDGTFQPPGFVVADLGYDHGWRIDKHPRLLAKLTDANRMDIVGFGDHGVWTALSNGDGAFQPPQLVLENFALHAGSWHVGKHPRFVADITGNGLGDIVGFGDQAVYTARGNGDGTFQPVQIGLSVSFTVINGWLEEHPRFLVDLNGDGRADIIGFNYNGAPVAVSKGDGTFKQIDGGTASFNWFNSALVITRNDRESADSGIYRSVSDGLLWEQVHRFPPLTSGSSPVPPLAGQLVAAPGNDHMVFAAGGTALAVSRDGGATFQDVLPVPGGPSGVYHHVAVAPAPDGTATPPAVYCLGNNRLFLSFNGGTDWVEVAGPLPAGAGGPIGTANSRAPSVLVVSPKFPLELYLVTNERKLFRGSITNIFGTPQSSWEEVVEPNLDGQDSGNVFLGATLPGRGDLLFYSPQRSKMFVGPLFPQSPSDWVQLDQGNSVHVDLHGMRLSSDFEASIHNGSYHFVRGTMWLVSDGGVYKSTDGGRHFQVQEGINTLSVVNVAGVAVAGSGPALSLNTGDNDGFYSMDGGAHWSPQDYGGGDNDCSYADPLRSHSMLIYTPRWDKHGHGVAGRLGQTVTVYETTPGHLPDARQGTNQAHTVPGPPLSSDGSPIWNAGSFFGMRGSRPLILNMPADAASTPGDYVFVRFRAGSPSVVVRTQNILGIANRADWDSNPSLVTQQGPPLPAADAGVLQASGGHAEPVFYVGGDSRNRLWKWTSGMAAWQQLVPAGLARAARRFFVSPYNPNLVYLLDNQDVKRSDDGGITWQTDSNLQLQLTTGGRIPIERAELSGEGDHVEFVLTDMAFDPFHPLVRFAVGEGGAFGTVDGVTWTRLLHTGALPGRPVNCYYDFVSDPSNRALYVGFAGRSIVKIGPLPLPGSGSGTLTAVRNPVSVAGHFSSGDQRHLVVVGSSAGKIHEVFWKPAQIGIEGEDDLPLAFGQGTIVSVGSMYDRDQQRHIVVVGTTAGKIHEIFWKPETVGIEGHDDLPVNFATNSIVGVAGLYDTDQQRYVAIVGTNAGKVREIFWKSDTVGIEGTDDLPVAFAAGSIVAVTALYDSDQQRYLVVVGTSAGKLHEIYWKADTVGIEGHDDLPVDFGSGSIVAVSGFYDTYRQRYVVAVGTADGTVRQVYWKASTGGIEANTVVAKFTENSIVSLAAFYSETDKVKHIVVALSNGQLQEFWFTPDI
jgi:hypothetical protein